MSYIKLYRKIQTSWLFQEEANQASAWIDLLLMAAWKEHLLPDGRIQKRGQVFTSQCALSLRWDWTLKRVRCFLERLRKHGMITFLPYERCGTIITICNYESYQNEKQGTTEGHTEGQSEGETEVLTPQGQLTLPGITEGTTEGTTEGLQQKKIRSNKNTTDSLVPKIGTEQSVTPILTFPCVGTPNVWHLTQDQVDQWTQLFPGLNIVQECKRALAWVQANTRKTERGMPKFLVKWFCRANDSGRAQPAKAKALEHLLGNRWEDAADVNLSSEVTNVD